MVGVAAEEVRAAAGHDDGVGPVEQRQETAPDPGDIGPEGPLDGPVENAAVHGELRAEVVRRADVRTHRVHARRCKDRLGIEHVVGDGIEGVRGEGQPVVPEAEVRSGVVFGRFLPLEVAGRGADREGGGAVVGAPGADQGHGRPVADTRHRTGLSRGEADFQFGQDGVLREPFLIGGEPGEGGGREGAEAAFLREAGGAVRADGQVEDVAVVPVHHGAGEPGFEGIGGVIDAVREDLRAGGDQAEGRGRVGLIGIVRAHEAELLVGVALPGMAGHGRVTQRARAALIREDVVENVAEGVVLPFRDGAPARVEGAGVVVLRQLLRRQVEDAVAADGGGVFQALERGEVEGDGRGDAAGVDPPFLLVDEHHRVVADEAGRGHNHIAPVRAVRRVPGLLLAGGAEDLQRGRGLLGLVLAGPGEGGIEVEGQPGSDLVAEFRPARVLVPGRVPDVSLLRVHAAGDIEGELVAAAGEAHARGGGLRPFPGDGADPVEIGGLRGNVEGADLELLEVVIVDGLGHRADILLRIGHRHVVGDLAEAGLHAGVDARGAPLAGLGRDEDDAGVAAGAVNGCRRGVFQYFDALDVLIVEGGILLCGDAVDDIQRGRAAGDGADAADDDVRAAARRAAGAGDADAGRMALEGLDRIIGGAAVHLVHPDGSDGGTDEFPGSGAVPDDDDLVEGLPVERKDHVDDGVVPGPGLLLQVSEAGKAEQGPRGGRNAVAAVEVRGHAFPRAADEDGRAEERRPVFIPNGSGIRPAGLRLVLGRRRKDDGRREEQEGREEDSGESFFQVHVLLFMASQRYGFYRVFANRRRLFENMSLAA